MDISRAEQRILHLLAQGGSIHLLKTDIGEVAGFECYTRDGWLYSGFDLLMFRKLKRKKAISSSGGKPYRITQRGLVLVRGTQQSLMIKEARPAMAGRVFTKS